MAKIKIQYDKLPHQDEFHEATEFFTHMSGGMGSGKTYGLCMKGFRLMSRNRGMPGGILCPDLKMFKRDVLPTFDQICQEHSIPMKYRRADSELVFPTTGTHLMIFHSQDDGRSIRGPNLAFALVNEATLCTKAAFEALITRVRLKDAKLPQIASSGTPEGFNWFYSEFIENPKPNARIVYADTRSNVHVSKEYVSRLQGLSEQAKQAYLEGRFVNMQGKTACQEFDRHSHGIRGTEIDRDYPLWIAIDFNVDPMAASLWQPIPSGMGKTILRGVGEIKLRDASTDTLGEHLANLIGRNYANVVLFPDPAGNARSTKSSFTDIAILRRWGFKDIRFKSRIASVRDQMNALNDKFSRGEIQIDLTKMPETVKDLEQVVWKDGLWEFDKDDSMRTHWLDGLKNMVDYEFPFAELRGGWRQDQIR